MSDTLTISRVANGWIVAPGQGTQEFTHVYSDPEALAVHVAEWATAQIDPRITKRLP
jgi:hypothetical protein